MAGRLQTALPWVDLQCVTLPAGGTSMDDTQASDLRPQTEYPPRDYGPPKRPFNITWLIVGLLAVGLALAGWKIAGSPRGGWLDDLNDGIDAADSAGKPMLVFYTADWCPPCRELKRGVLHDSDVMAGLHENYVLVKVDLTKRSGPAAELAQEFNVRGIPTVILMDSRGVEFDRFTGGGAGMDGWIRRCAR